MLHWSVLIGSVRKQTSAMKKIVMSGLCAFALLIAMPSMAQDVLQSKEQKKEMRAAQKREKAEKKMAKAASKGVNGNMNDAGDKMEKAEKKMEKARKKEAKSDN